jgi:hypothetical protein
MLETQTLEIAQANVKASAVAQSAALNAQLEFHFQTAFDNWKISVEAGRIPNTNPPRPPKAFAPTDDGNGWFSPVQGSEPVCEMPPIPEDRFTPKAAPPAMNIDIGAEVPGCGGTWFAAGERDSYPAGKQTPPMQGPPDGLVHVYVRVGTPVGRGWYERVR